MRKLLLRMMCLAAMMATGMGLKAQEVTVTLIPGWTWISYPSTEAVDFATALGDFTPQIGDIIKSQWGSATYKSNGQWRGNISQFSPGYGYHYYSNRTTPVIVTFNAQQPAPQVVVTTSEPMLITAISAMCGGEVTVSDGTYILAKGLCWATHEDPTTNEDYFLDAGSGVGSFSASMTELNLSTTYYVRAFAVSANGTFYGDQKTFTTRDGIPTLTTAEVTDITGFTATCGGDITDNGGLNITSRGVCWSTSPNPTIADPHTIDDSGTGNFSSSITGLNLSTTYYVRAYATTILGIVYGEQKSFTTLDYAGTWVDLGLPSGLLWATCNLGADNPEDYGDYFAWGETQPKDTYDWSNYHYYNGGQLIKYTESDGLTILQPEDDAATVNWGTDWRMPTWEEWQELCNNTTSTWTTQNGINGRLFTAENGNSLFLPSGGKCWYLGLSFVGESGYYWSSSLVVDPPYYDFWYYSAYYISTYEVDDLEDYGHRCHGRSVRPVCSDPQNTFIINVTANPSEGGDVSGGGRIRAGAECMLTATANEGYTFINWTENGEAVSTEATYSFTVNADRALVANFIWTGGEHLYVDLGLPSGLLWATCNVGADTPEDYGDYFAWGETQPKDTYNWSTYQYCMGSYTTMTKYCNNSSYGYNGFTDNLTTLLPEDDAATANWGNGWRMPTREEWLELYQNTTVTWTTQNGVNGRLFTASDGNSLFLPAAGCRDNSSLYFAGSYGSYWSSSLSTVFPSNAWGLYFRSDDFYMGNDYRCYGQSVRPVCSSRQN